MKTKVLSVVSLAFSLIAGEMKKLFIAATTAAMLVAAPPAFATLINYELVGVTATQPNGLIDTITGTFTIDTNSNSYVTNSQVFDNGNSGLVPSGTYSVSSGDASSELHFFNPSDTFMIDIDFSPVLGTNNPASITLINYYNAYPTGCPPGVGCQYGSGGPFSFISSATGTSVTGEADPIAFSSSPSAVPEPSTWILMLSGFAGVGFMVYRRKRDDSVSDISR
jgi:hypothetical protein